MNHAVLTKQDIHGTPPRTVAGNFLVTLTHSKVTEDGRVFAASFVDPAKETAWAKLVGKSALLLTEDELALDGWRSLARPERKERPTDRVRQSPGIDERRETLLQGIDQRTQAALIEGFEVKGKRFSASTNAQLKWLGLYVSKDLLAYPMMVPTIDDAALVTLANAEDVSTYYKALMEHLRSALDAGTALKQGAKKAKTLDAVNDLLSGLKGE